MIERLGHLFSHRELLWALVVKDMKIRYKSATLGFLWTLLTPMAMMAIFTALFMMVLRVKIEKFPAFFLSGYLPWHFFATSLGTSTSSLVDNSNLIKKVSFPRELIPFSGVLSALVHFLISLPVLLVFLLIFKVHLGWSLALFPFVLGLHLLFTMGLVLMLSSWHVFYRDVAHLLEACLPLWFYVTPVVYPLPWVPKGLLFLFSLNPMASFIGLYRGVVLDGMFPDGRLWLLGLGYALLFLWLGMAAFRSHEPLLAEEL